MITVKRCRTEEIADVHGKDNYLDREMMLENEDPRTEPPLGGLSVLLKPGLLVRFGIT